MSDNYYKLYKVWVRYSSGMPYVVIHYVVATSIQKLYEYFDNEEYVEVIKIKCKSVKKDLIILE